MTWNFPLHTNLLGLFLKFVSFQDSFLDNSLNLNLLFFSYLQDCLHQGRWNLDHTPIVPLNSFQTLDALIAKRHVSGGQICVEIEFADATENHRNHQFTLLFKLDAPCVSQLSEPIFLYGKLFLGKGHLRQYLPHRNVLCFDRLTFIV